MSLSVRPVEAADRAPWGRLSAAYATFYGVEQDEAMRERVFGWLLDDAAESRGLVALDARGDLVGLVHFRPFARPLSATTGCYLDDLFVDPGRRGSGVVEALFAALEEIVAAAGWSVVRGITRAGNRRARAVYDRVAERTDWVTYDHMPTPQAGPASQ